MSQLGSCQGKRTHHKRFKWEMWRGTSRLEGQRRNSEALETDRSGKPFPSARIEGNRWRRGEKVESAYRTVPAQG